METQKRRDFLINFAYFAVIVALVFLVVKYFLPMVTPFAIAFVIVYLLRRPIRFVSKRFNLPWKPVAALAVLLFYATVGTLISLISIKGVSALAGLIGMLPTIYQTHALPFLSGAFESLEELFSRMDPTLAVTLENTANQLLNSLSSLVTGLSGKALGLVSGVATALPGTFINIVVMIISTFFIAMDYNKLMGFCIRQMNERTKFFFVEIKDYVAGTLLVCIRSYLTIMFITFVELSIGLTIVGIQHAPLIAFLIAIFDILPVLGTGGIMIPWIVLALIQGDLKLSLGLLIIYIVITVIRNIIEPKIVGSQLGLHPVVTLTSMFVGVQLLGVIGLFGFPIGLSLLRHLNDHGAIRVFK